MYVTEIANLGGLRIYAVSLQDAVTLGGAHGGRRSRVAEYTRFHEWSWQLIFLLNSKFNHPGKHRKTKNRQLPKMTPVVMQLRRH